MRGFAPGDLVVGRGGGQDYALFGPGEAARIDPIARPTCCARRRRLTIRGCIVLDFAPGDFLKDVGQWVRAGRLRYREDIRTGLEHAPEALIGLLEGENFGKLLIRVAPDPTA